MKTETIKQNLTEEEKAERLANSNRVPTSKRVKTLREKLFSNSFKISNGKETEEERLERMKREDEERKEREKQHKLELIEELKEEDEEVYDFLYAADYCGALDDKDLLELDFEDIEGLRYELNQIMECETGLDCSSYSSFEEYFDGIACDLVDIAPDSFAYKYLDWEQMKDDISVDTNYYDDGAGSCWVFY